jgi:4a-hydroxytetrahydrobiopterin dehydratase
MATNLAARKCVAFRGGEPTLTDAEIAELPPQIPDWRIYSAFGACFQVEELYRSVCVYEQNAMISEKEDHHPLTFTEWRRLTVPWWPHKIKGLHKNNFIMAAKTDEVHGQ